MNPAVLFQVPLVHCFVITMLLWTSEGLRVMGFGVFSEVPYVGVDFRASRIYTLVVWMSSVREFVGLQLRLERVAFATAQEFKSLGDSFLGDPLRV